jgi:predicted nucleotidyltransferase
MIPEPFRDDVMAAMAVLRDYGAHEVYVFGSLASTTWHDDSDIDLAVTGIDPRQFLKAYALASRPLTHELDVTRPLFSVLVANGDTA